MSDVRFTDGEYSEDFGKWAIRAYANPLGLPDVYASDSDHNRVVLDGDRDVAIDARYVPLALIERMIAVWRALGGE